MKNFKKLMIAVIALMIIAAAATVSFAQGPAGEKAYWGIDGSTLVISRGETGCPVGGSFSTLADFDMNEGRPWLSYKDGITAVRVDGTAGKVEIRDCTDLFYGLNRLVSADLSGLDTSGTTSMWCLFDGCSSLGSVDVSMLDTSNVANMQGMFYQCGSLESLDLRSFDTRKVTNMYAMFAGCASLRSVDLSSFDMSGVQNATDMFADCSQLSEVKLGAGWNAEGAPTVASWKKVDDNTWYSVDMNGNNLSGWQKLWWNGNENWYYFSQEPGASYGICQLGGVTPDGYQLSASGAWIR